MSDRRLHKNILVPIVGRRRMHCDTKSMLARLFADKMPGWTDNYSRLRPAFGDRPTEKREMGELHLISHLPIEGDRTKSIKV